MAKNCCIKVHTTKAEYEKCKARALAAKLSLSSYMLQAGLANARYTSKQDFLRDLAVREKMLDHLETLAVQVTSEPLHYDHSLQLLRKLSDIEIVLRSVQHQRNPS